MLSIQSSVVYGHVGNSVAVFALQRLGHEVWALPTTLLAHHTGYGSRRGAMVDPTLLRELVSGLVDLGVLGSVDAVLVGYLGAVEPIEIVGEVVRRVRQANPHATVCLDPVLGDIDRGFYVPPGVAESVRDQLVPTADVLTPNVFELAALTGRTAEAMADPDAVTAAADELRACGPGIVLVTSVPAGDEVGLLACSPAGRFRVVTPRLPRSFEGAGDLTAALFLGTLSAGVPAALARTASSVHAVLAATSRSGQRELRVIEAAGCTGASAGRIRGDPAALGRQLSRSRSASPPKR